jgi:hypothetical protein
MKGRKPSATRHVTRTGHAPIVEPPPVVNADIGRPPRDLKGLGRWFWDAYVEERAAHKALNKLDRVSLVLAARCVQAAGEGEKSQMEAARRWLCELCATPATRIKIAYALKRQQPAGTPTPTAPAVQPAAVGIREKLRALAGGRAAGG